MSAVRPQHMEPNLEPLFAQLPSNLPINKETFFVKKGFGSKRANVTRIKATTHLEPALKAMLGPDEVIQFVSVGVVNLPIEAAVIGAMSYLINRCALVATDRRVLIFHTDGNFKPKSFVNQINYTAIKKVKKGFFGNFLEIASPKMKRGFTGLPRTDVSALKEIIPVTATPKGSFEFVCPACFVPSQTLSQVCSHCQTPFKSPNVAAVRSLVLPGLGDWYLGHRFFAALEMVGALFVWAVNIFLLLVIGLTALPIVIAILVIFNAFDAIVTYFQAKKGLMSLDGQLPTAPAQQGVRYVPPA